MEGRVRTRRWNDPKQPGDGTRVLVCRFRPRALKKLDETWDEWRRELGPSEQLHAAVYGKGQPAIPFDEYRDATSPSSTRTRRAPDCASCRIESRRASA